MQQAPPRSSARTAPLDKIATPEPCMADEFVHSYTSEGDFEWPAAFSIKAVRSPQGRTHFHVVFMDGSIVQIRRTERGTLSARVVCKEITPE